MHVCTYGGSIAAAIVCEIVKASINDRHVRIDSRPQRGLENSPDRLVIRGANTRNGIVNQTLDRSVLVGAADVVADASDVASGVTLALEENSVGVRGGALLVAGVEVLRSRIVLVRGREGDRGFLEAAQYRALVQNGFQLILLQADRRLLREARVRDPLDHLLPRLRQAEIQIAAPKHAVEVLRHV